MSATTTTTTTTATTPENVVEHKVFIGNLAFKTTQESLTNFAKTSGKIIEATIITRGSRSLGYGFITFDTEKEAEKAAKDLNKQLLDEREINVELARPKTKEPKKKTRKAKKATVTTDDDAASSPQPTTTTTDAAVVMEEKQVTPPVASPSTSEDEAATKKKEAAARRRLNKKNKKRQNKKKAVRTPRSFTPSDTTLFVANLPYATVDDDLKTIFKDYKLVSAHVARMKNGKSKGYGFAEFETEEQQQKALELVQDVVLEGRAIYSKVALSEEKPEEVAMDSSISEIKKENGNADIPATTAEVKKVNDQVKKEATTPKKTETAVETKVAEDKKEKTPEKAQVKKESVPEAPVKEATIKEDPKKTDATSEVEALQVKDTKK